ncbi:hypothetical protein LTR85_012232 [Meristemomyces frigidus]|nr:hypothetical protein LTR85_012232 [Meristemomyces frigidus]
MYLRKRARNPKDSNTSSMRIIELRTRAFSKSSTGTAEAEKPCWTMSIRGNSRLVWEHPDPDVHNIKTINVYIKFMAQYMLTEGFRSRNKRLGVRYRTRNEKLWAYLDWTVEEMLEVIAFAHMAVRWHTM